MNREKKQRDLDGAGDPRSHGVRAVVNSLAVPLAILGLALGSVSQVDVAGAASMAPRPPSLPAQGQPLDFASCIQLALTQSPQLTRSATEIEIRRLDESDSRWSFIPTLSLSTQVYVYQPQELDTRGYSIDFVSSQFNPLASHFSLQASKLLTQIARLNHLKVIANGIHQLGQKFIQLGRKQEATAYQDELVGLVRQKAAFLRQLQAMGKASALEVRAVEHQEKLILAERQGMASAERPLESEMKQFLGLPPEALLTLDLPQARHQILAEFDPEAASLDQFLGNALELKILKLREEVQRYNISQAYGRYLPTLFFGLRTPDPLSTSADRDLFFSIGINLPIWDSMQRSNNISRQKLVLRQYEAETAARRGELATQFRLVQEQRQRAADTLLLAQSAEELARLRESQTKIRYQANGHNLAALLDDRIAHGEARKQTLTRALELDLASLHLRHLCGDLLKRYVNPMSGEN